MYSFRNLRNLLILVIVGPKDLSPIRGKGGQEDYDRPDAEEPKGFLEPSHFLTPGVLGFGGVGIVKGF